MIAHYSVWRMRVLPNSLNKARVLSKNEKIRQFLAVRIIERHKNQH